MSKKIVVITGSPRSAALLKRHMAGEVLIPGVVNAGDIDKKEGCGKEAELEEKI